jgi:hypothetical protein
VMKRGGLVLICGCLIYLFTVVCDLFMQGDGGMRMTRPPSTTVNLRQDNKRLWCLFSVLLATLGWHFVLGGGIRFRSRW